MAVPCENLFGSVTLCVSLSSCLVPVTVSLVFLPVAIPSLVALASVGQQARTSVCSVHGSSALFRCHCAFCCGVCYVCRYFVSLLLFDFFLHQARSNTPFFIEYFLSLSLPPPLPPPAHSSTCAYSPCVYPSPSTLWPHLTR